MQVAAARTSGKDVLQGCEEGEVQVRLGRSKHAVALTALMAGLSLQAASAQTPAPGVGAAPPKLAEEVFKNIQSLKGTPADQVIPAMQFISASLNVECSFCHVQGKMDLDDKKEKKTARDMIAMTNAINTGPL
jgi:hypothetical protein